jgi:hypothetical protein
VTAAGPDLGSEIGNVAKALRGEPNKRLSSRHELRFGDHGSLSIDLHNGRWFDHEAQTGGNVIELVKHELHCDRATAVAWLVEQGYLEEREPQPERPRRTNGHATNGHATNGNAQHEHEPPSLDVAWYIYRNADGEPLYRVVREDPKRFRQERYVPERDSYTRARGCMDGVQMVPYRLDEVLAEPGMPVYVVEGEKDVDNLLLAGLIATTNPGGTGKWRDEYSALLADRDIIVLPDNDPLCENPTTPEERRKQRGQGRKHAAQVIRSLLPHAARVRLLELPDLPPKGDVSDWLELGHTAEDLAEQVERHAYVPNEAVIGRLEQGKVGRAETFKIIPVKLFFTSPPEREFLVEGWIPIGVVTSLYGPPGSGKSFLVQYLMSACATNHTWVDLPTRHCPTFGILAEDDTDEIHRRQAIINRYLGIKESDLAGNLNIADLDEDLVYLMTARGDTEPKLTAVYERLVEAVDQIRPGLTVLDNIAQLFDGNENDRGLVSRFLRHLNGIARRRRTAIVLLGHPSRGGHGEGEHYSGSSAWNAGVRARVEFEPLKQKDQDDPNEPSRYTLTLVKANHKKAGNKNLVQPLVWNEEASMVVPDRPEIRSQLDLAEAAHAAAAVEQHVTNCISNLWANAGLNLSDNPKAANNYLPKRLELLGMLGGFTRRQIEDGMHRLMAAGKIRRATVGRFDKGKPKEGLVVVAT